MINKQEHILVLGAYGTVGTHLKKLLEYGGYQYLAPTHSECDLLDYSKILYYIGWYDIEVVINLAAKKTTIRLNAESPDEIYSDTVQMALNVFRACSERNVKRVVSVISSCAYPFTADQPLREIDFDKGPPHPSILPHGQAKRSLYYLSKFYRQRYGLDAVNIVFNNIYGGQSFDKPDQLKVCDALVNKFVCAKRDNLPSVEVWGSGVALRELLYYKDAAAAILKVYEDYDDDGLLNVGNGEEISIKELAILIKILVGYEGKIVFDTSKPDGQLRKLLSNQRMKERLGWSPPTTLEDGLMETIRECQKQ